MTIPPLLIVAACAVILFALERRFPLRRRKAAQLSRLAVNIAVSLTTFATAFLLVKPVTRFMLGFTEGEGFGILPWLGLKGPVEIMAGFLLLDLAFYYWHVANHKLPFLWRFHNVHHIDPDLDVSTGFRFHPGEVALSVIFRAVQVAVIGVSASTFLLYEAVFQIATFFHHSNLRLPLGFERALNLVFVTPRMHGIHHSNFRSETDSNYSVVFSVWDRLHQSIGLGIPQDEIEIGVPGYSGPKDNDLGRIFRLPFERQRDYWQPPEGARRIERESGPARRSQQLAG